MEGNHMPFIFYNPNPKNQRVGDCAVRAVSKAIGRDWDETYIALCTEGLVEKDMPSSNYVWGNYLRKFGFDGREIPSDCPECVTVEEFTERHPRGRYVLATQNHVLTAIDGNFYDTWPSGNETVIYFYKKET
jgi:hypothetical protein